MPLKQGDQLQDPTDGRRFATVELHRRRKKLGFECPTSGDFWQAVDIRKMANDASRYDGRSIEIHECVAQQLACDGSIDGPGW